MKALQPLFARNARRSSSTCCRRQTKQWTQHTIVFSFQLFCFAKSRICAYFTVNVQIIRIHALCFILREFCSKIKPQKERWNFPFILARARSRLCHKWLRSEVSKMERGSQNIHGGGHWVTQYRNTVKKKNGKNRNTAWKIVQIPIPHILITFIIGSAYLWLLPAGAFNYLRHLCTRFHASLFCALYRKESANKR